MATIMGRRLCCRLAMVDRQRWDEMAMGLFQFGFGRRVIYFSFHFFIGILIILYLYGNIIKSHFTLHLIDQRKSNFISLIN